MRANNDGLVFKNVPAGTYPFTIKVGGVYSITLSGTTPTAQLNRLSSDGSTFVPQGSSISAAGVTAPIYLGPGNFNLVLTGSALFADITRIPTE